MAVRKVLGARAAHLVGLMSKDMLALVIISFGMVSPLDWWLLERWLENFAYRIQIDWWIFARCGLGTLLVAPLTVSIQTSKVALQNPVTTLRGSD